METLDSTELLERLGDAEWQTQKAAADALFERGAEALDALSAGLGHSNALVRTWCADLMDHLADDRCVAPLQQALKDPMERVRRHAVHSWGCQGCKVTPLQADIVGLLIESALHDPSIRVRRVATHQLGLQPPDPRAIAALERILQSSNDVKLRSRAEFALQMQTTGNPKARGAA
jgi:HEAT repeat protein